jgi:hypothetical protein
MDRIGKVGREVVKKLDYQAETCLIITINSEPLIMNLDRCVYVSTPRPVNELTGGRRWTVHRITVRQSHHKLSQLSLSYVC